MFISSAYAASGAQATWMEAFPWPILVIFVLFYFMLVRPQMKQAKEQREMIAALKVGDVIVQIDPRYYRPTEVETLLGDPSKAKEKLGWVPEITLDQMIVEMVANDLDQAKQHALLQKHGYSVAVGKEN